MTVALTLVWALGCFAVNGAQQARLVAMAPPLASASVSLNSSAIYLGQALGAFIGGLILTAHGTGGLSWFGMLPMGGAILVSMFAANMANRHRLHAVS